ncbi:MAG: hypothetical protein CMF59_05965 [Leptospiraceae bacterium]|nr:hypothetical protein [Leptospiraceae bacterium]
MPETEVSNLPNVTRLGRSVGSGFPAGLGAIGPNALEVLSISPFFLARPGMPLFGKNRYLLYLPANGQYSRILDAGIPNRNGLNRQKKSAGGNPGILEFARTMD